MWKRSKGMQRTRETGPGFTTALLFYKSPSHLLKNRHQTTCFIVKHFHWETGKVWPVTRTCSGHHFSAATCWTLNAISICTFSSFSGRTCSHQIFRQPSEHPLYYLIKLPIKPMGSEELVSLIRLMLELCSLCWRPGMKRHLCRLPKARMFLAIFSLRKHVTLSTIQLSPHGNISNERYSSPSGLGVLDGLKTSGLCVPPGQTWQLWTN